MGLDRPLYEQYVIYLQQLLSGDLGKSVINNRSVIDELASRFPATIELTVGALLLATGIGIPLGRWAARRAQTWGDGLVTIISLLGVSIPIFVLIDSLLQGDLAAFWDGIRHLILPAIALGSIPLAIITRITRASVLDVTNEDHVRTARAKGLGERKINARHIMRNAW